MLKFLQRKKDSKKALLEALQGGSPPSFPANVMELLRMLRDPESELPQIAEALEWDPGLVIRILRLVNSSAIGLSHQVEDVRHAATILGRSRLEQLVLSVAVKDALPKTPTRGFDPQRFWMTAFARAAAARMIAAELHPADEAQSFTGGLLQDVAVPILAHSREEYDDVLIEWHSSPGTNLHQLERSALGISHDEVGGNLAVEWDLPDGLAFAIHAHHSPEEADHALPPALRLVAIQRETEHEYGIEAIIEEGRTRYETDPDWLRQVLTASSEQAAELSSLI